MTDRELMQQALNALEQVAEYFNADSTEAKTITALRERLAQPEQEPVAVTRLEDGYIKIDYLADPFPVGFLYAAPLQSAQPYPDNFIDALKYDVAKRDSEAEQQKLTPYMVHAHGAIQRIAPNKPLTDAQIKVGWRTLPIQAPMSWSAYLAGARMAEAAHGITGEDK